MAGHIRRRGHRLKEFYILTTDDTDRRRRVVGSYQLLKPENEATLVLKDRISIEMENLLPGIYRSRCHAKKKLDGGQLNIHIAMLQLDVSLDALLRSVLSLSCYCLSGYEKWGEKISHFVLVALHCPWRDDAVLNLFPIRQMVNSPLANQPLQRTVQVRA